MAAVCWEDRASSADWEDSGAAGAAAAVDEEAAAAAAVATAEAWAWVYSGGVRVAATALGG